MSDKFRLYCVDALEGLRVMPDACVDLVNTDPPYNVKKKYADWNDDLPENEYWWWYRLVFIEVFRVMRNGYLYVSCSQFQTAKVREILEWCGFKFLQTLVWHRPNFVSRVVRSKWKLSYEPILFFCKGKRPPMVNTYFPGKNTHDVLIYASPQTNYKRDKKTHVCQKPIDLYKHMISRTPGQIVLDPFMGSGTTGVACREYGRTFIGFDMSLEYVEMARARIEHKGKQEALAKW